LTIHYHRAIQDASIIYLLLSTSRGRPHDRLRMLVPNGLDPWSLPIEELLGLVGPGGLVRFTKWPLDLVARAELSPRTLIVSIGPSDDADEWFFAFHAAFGTKPIWMGRHRWRQVLESHGRLPRNWR
jgi:hypothetical protein